MYIGINLIRDFSEHQICVTVRKYENEYIPCAVFRNFQTHILHYEEFCYRLYGIMRKSVISSYSDTVLFIRHYAESRQRTCVDMRFSTLFVIRCYTIIAE